MNRMPVIVSGAILGLAVTAAPASASSLTWVQQFERPSATAPCASPANETPWQSTYTGSQAWSPSWAEWANGGKGGWVCTRTIVWGSAADEADPVDN